MKKIGLLVGVLLLSLLLLASCSNAQVDALSQEVVGEQKTAAEAQEGEPLEDQVPDNLSDIPLSFQIGMGILKLDGTVNSVDAAQAGRLLVLWKAVRSLSDSETTAVEEMNALTNQIQGEMSKAQLEAITYMDLNGRDLISIVDELGLEIAEGVGNFGGFSGEVTDEMRATAQAARESGEAPGGFGQGRGMGMGQGPGGGEGQFQDMSPEEMRAAMEESGGFRRANMGVNPLLLEAVIQYLEGLAQ
jgi:hypothetical protein